VFDEQFKPVNHPLAMAFNQNCKEFRSLNEIILHPTFPFALIIELGRDPDQKILDAIPADKYVELSEPIRAEQRRRTLYRFHWSESDPKKRFIPLISIAGSIWGSYNPTNSFSEFTFSPDGKWVIFRDYSESSDNPVFVSVPIGANNPLYLGKPIKLGNALRKDAIGPKGTAWTTNPTAFVMSDGLILYRWNMDKIPSLQRIKLPNQSPK
jgi:hypothetical protein